MLHTLQGAVHGQARGGLASNESLRNAHAAQLIRCMMQTAAVLNRASCARGGLVSSYSLQDARVAVQQLAR
jgi:hypothetical protein